MDDNRQKIEEEFASNDADKMEQGGNPVKELASGSDPAPSVTPEPQPGWSQAILDLIQKHQKLRIYITAHEPLRNYVLAECDVSAERTFWMTDNKKLTPEIRNEILSRALREGGA